MILLTGLMLSGCKKEKAVQVPFDTIQLNEHTSVLDISFINDTLGFACGGKRETSGFLYRTIDGGETWSSYETSSNRCMYSVETNNNEFGMVGSDELYIRKSVNNGTNWSIYWYEADELPVHEIQRGAVRNFWLSDDSVAYFVSGKNYDVGAVYRTTDGGESWVFQSMEHELRGIDFVDRNTGYICGFGYLAKTTDGGSTYEQLNLLDDFFVAVTALGTGTVVVAGNNGGIYKSENSGVDWITIIKPNGILGSRMNFNAMEFLNNNIGYAVGNYGVIMRTTDGGSSWQELSISTESHLHAIAFRSGNVYITADDGQIFVL